MKFLQSSFFRALTAIVVGVLLVKYPDNTVTGLTIAIGVLFLLSGIVSVLTYWYARRHTTQYKIYDENGKLIAGQAPMFPIVGIGSILLGGILALMPTTFVSALMYVIGAILILGAVGQFFALIAARRFAPMSLLFWVFPSLILLAGLYVLIKPMAPLSAAMQVLGWLTLAYGVVEAVNSLAIYSHRRRWQKAQEQQQAELEATVAEPEEAKEKPEAE